MPYKDPVEKRTYARGYYHRNKESIQARNKTYYDPVKKHTSHILRKYGITKEQYDNLVIKQDNCCAICERPADSDRRMHVDHDHETGKVRGLLCYTCNVSLERFDKYKDKINEYLLNRVA